MQSDGSGADEELYELEVLDGEIVEHARALSKPAAGERLPGWVSPPAVQAAVAAATGFVAGAATLALLRRYGMARLERGAAARVGETLPALPAAGDGRTYIVHVRPLRPYAE